MELAADTEKNRKVIVSGAWPDGTLTETVFSAEEDATNLIVARADEIRTLPAWEYQGQQYAPIRPDNNLLRHKAVLLPSEPAKFSTVEELVDEICRYIRAYVVLPDHHVQIAAGFVLLSWVYDAFNELPYLRFRGEYGTGKSRALIVIGSLCYKVFFASGASTVAPIFHTLDLFRGTLVLDEADFRFSDEKAELVKILNNGNARGFPVLRMQANTRKEFDPRAFRVFGPKIVGMRSSYEDRALESRFITIQMDSGRGSSGVPINLPDKQREDALTLRNKLLTYRLRTRYEIELDPGLADSTLEARTNQILLPLLSVVPTDEMRTAILSLARQSHVSVLSERTGSTEGRVLTCLRRLSLDQRDPVGVSDVSTALGEAFGTEYERPITHRWVAKILRRLGIDLYKRNGVVVLVPGQVKRLTALYERYGITGEELATTDETQGD